MYIRVGTHVSAATCVCEIGDVITEDRLLCRVQKKMVWNSPEGCVSRHVNGEVPTYSLFYGFWQSFITIRSCNHLMRIILTYVSNAKKNEIS